MKKIFIYYSLSGNGDMVADYLSNKDITIRKVISSEKMPKSNFLRILVGGYLAAKGHMAKLVDFDNNINNYDEVIIGSPIWNGRLVPAINTILKELDLSNKKLTFILYSGSGKAPKAISKIEEVYKDAKIINIREPKKNKVLIDESLKDI